MPGELECRRERAKGATGAPRLASGKHAEKKALLCASSHPRRLTWLVRRAETRLNAIACIGADVATKHAEPCRRCR